MRLTFFLVVLAWPTLAQVPSGKPQAAGESPQLNCPPGTRQTGGKDSVYEAAFCSKAGRLGELVMHGPYVGLYKSGRKQVEGAYLDGKRTGLWVAWDESGAKIEELTFENDLWSGKRTQWVNGQKVLEENWVAGKRQGPQREWVKGREVVTEFVNDAPVKK